MAKNVKEYLEDAGFNMVALPKSNIAPLQLLSFERGILERVGDIDDLFMKGNILKPEIEYSVGVPNELRDNSGAILKAKGSFKFLDKILETFGIKGGGVQAEIKNQNTLSYEFLDPELDEVGKIKIDNYLNSAQVIGKGTYVDKLKNDEICIITQCLKSNGISITNARDINIEASAALPNIQNAIGAEIEFQRTKNTSLEVRFKGNKQLVFAVQAVRIFYYAKEQVYRLKSVDRETVRHDGFVSFPDSPNAMDF